MNSDTRKLYKKLYNVIFVIIAMGVFLFNADISNMALALRSQATSKTGEKLQMPSTTALKAINESVNRDGLHILSLGPGNFKDEHYFASCGHSVTAIEKKKEAGKHVEPDSDVEALWGNMVDVLPELAVDRPGQFDVVYARLSLHYLNKLELEQIFQSVKTLLKPSGRFYFVVKTKKDPHYIRSIDEEGRKENEETWMLTYLDPQDKQEYDRQFFDEKKVMYYIETFGFQLNYCNPITQQLPQAENEGQTDEHTSTLYEVLATATSLDEPMHLRNQKAEKKQHSEEAIQGAA